MAPWTVYTLREVLEDRLADLITDIGGAWGWAWYWCEQNLEHLADQLEDDWDPDDPITVDLFCGTFNARITGWADYSQGGEQGDIETEIIDDWRCQHNHRHDVTVWEARDDLIAHILDTLYRDRPALIEAIVMGLNGQQPLPIPKNSTMAAAW